MAGYISDDDKAFVETWESVTDSSNFVIKFGPMGEHTYEGVHGRRKFTITTAERIVTQSRVLETANDPFLNGHFRPLLVPSTVTVETNPNALSDDDIHRVFQASEVAWHAYLDVLDAPATIRRMLELAENVDIPLKRYRELEHRLAQMSPRKQLVQRDQDLIASTGPAAPETTPPANPPGRPRKSSAQAAGSSSSAG